MRILAFQPPVVPSAAFLPEAWADGYASMGPKRAASKPAIQVFNAAGSVHVIRICRAIYS